MKVHTFLSKCLQTIAVLTVGLIFILNIIYTTTVSSDAAEKVTIQPQLFQSILFLILIAGLLFLLSLLKPRLERLKEYKTFLVFTGLYVLMAVYLLCNVDHVIRADALFVSEAAKDLLEGNLVSFQKGRYMNQFPHQTGLMLFDALLYLIFPGVTANFIANFCFVVGINYLIYKTTDFIFKDRFVNHLSIILSFLFLPQFFLILFAYGNIPGLFFMLFSFYYGLRFYRDHRTLNLVWMVLGACLAVLLRKNFFIGVIALLIYLGLNLLKQFSVKRVVAMALILVSLLLPLKVLPSLLAKDPGGMPSVLWVAMGTDIDNNDRGPGWYNGSWAAVVKDSDFNFEIAQEKGMEELKKNLKKMTDRPLETVEFFIKKNASQWCDPLYQSLWSGPLEDCNQYTHTPLLKSLYTGGSAKDLLSIALKIYMLAFFGCGFFFMLRYHKQGEGWELFFLLLIGGFLFHTFWEAKSQYVSSYFVPLIPFVAFSMAKICNKFKKAE